MNLSSAWDETENYVVAWYRRDGEPLAQLNSNEA